MKEHTYQQIVNRIAEIDWILEVTEADPNDPEVKAYRADRAEVIQALDEIRGTTFVNYRQFRRALEAGAPCEVLVDLKANMDKANDSLAYRDAADDLKRIGCYQKSAKRTDR